MRYPEETEDLMRLYYESLNERNRRRYAGMEALILGHGGQDYIAKVLGCSRKTVRKARSRSRGVAYAYSTKTYWQSFG